jgi:hypothetical protein
MTKTKRTPRKTAAEVVPYELSPIDDVAGRIAEADEFFAGRGEVRRTLARFTGALDAAGIPYAVIGAMALNAHGHIRVTNDIDVVLTGDARHRVHELLDGRGFLPPFEGSRNLRDTTNGVKIDLVLAGDFPGDGREKPVTFPDPSVEPIVVKDGVRYVTLEKLVELKLASGISQELRYKDLGDVVSLIGSALLPRDLGERLHPWVRPKWYEIWDAWDADPRKNDF